MNKPRIIAAMLIALAIAIYIPNLSWAQSGQPGQTQAYQSPAAGQPGQGVDLGQTGRQIPQPKGGIATVVGVDQPDNCLRIRSGPGGEYEVIACAPLGEQLNITGVWTSNNWAQLVDTGWVYGPQIQTDLRPPAAAYSRAESYVVEEGYPVVSYAQSYLPDYGYQTYWYGGVPLFLYSANIWRKYHPWWLRKNWNRNHNVWNRNPAFRQNVRAGTQATVTPNAAIRRNLATNRANVSSTNVARVNPNIARSRSPNVVGSGSTNLSARTFSSPNTVRSRTFSSPNVSARTFSTPNVRARTFSSPNISTRSFSSPNISTRSFSSPSTVRSGSMGARSFSAGRMGNVGSGANFSVGGGGRRR